MISNQVSIYEDVEDSNRDCSREEIFLNEDKSWSVFLTMCIGCKEEDIKFPDVDSELYQEHKCRNKILPTAATLRKEVIFLIKNR